jgi:hypothetical protein
MAIEEFDFSSVGSVRMGENFYWQNDIWAERAVFLIKMHDIR